MELAVGRVVKPHGLRGELLVQVHTDEPDERFAVGSSLGVSSTTNGPHAVTVQAVRWQGNRLVVRFEGVGDRTAAAGLRGAVLTVDSASLKPPSDPDEFYDHQLVGLAVELADGTTIGTVSDVVHGPGGELLVVAKVGGAEALVPFVRAIVPAVDVEAGRVVIEPPEGLLE